MERVPDVGQDASHPSSDEVGEHAIEWALYNAAVRTRGGRIVTIVAPEVNNDALSLCMEMGLTLRRTNRTRW